MLSAFVEEVNIRVLAVGEWLARIFSSWSALIGLALMAGITATMAGVGWFVPIANWDMFAYLASAHEVHGVTDPAAIHAYAFETVRQNISDGDFMVQTQDRAYRIRMFEDPQAFATMLGFYKVKFLYVQMLGWLSSVIDPYNAIRLLSVVPATLVGVLATFWLWREKALHLGALGVALLIAMMYGDIAREGTPDALSAMLFIAGLMAFVAKREMLVFVLLFLAFLARPDHIAYVGVLFFVAFFTRTPSWGAVAAFLVSLACYPFIMKAGGHPGWWVHMWFTNVEYVETLEGFDPAFSIIVYLKMIVRVLVRAMVEETWLVVLIAGCAAWWQMAKRSIGFTQRETTVLIATLLAIGAKSVIFPLSETRFWFPYLTVFGLVLIGAMRDIRWLPDQK